jgi:transposase InsO family protein
MDQRLQFIAEHLKRQRSVAELCGEFGISRKTGYKWVRRYTEAGPQGLQERSRRPLAHPAAVSQDLIGRLVALRLKHPRWGPKKLLAWLAAHEPEWHLPVASTVGQILARRQLVKRRRRHAHAVPSTTPLRTYDAPNAVWCADFKGHFPVAGQRCHPLTISDGHSRFLLRCVALTKPRWRPTRRGFEAAFRAYGLPAAIRTDNGPPFAALGVGGLSRLAVWWIRLGIIPERIKPGRPDQNGRHERMHRTLKAETARPPRSSFRAQQRAFDGFRQEYNHERPHEALGQATPASVYRPSRRPYPTTLSEPTYPADYLTARAYPNGVISVQGTQWYLSHALAGELVGLQPVDEARWVVYFGPVAVGLIDKLHAQPRGYRNFGHLQRLDARRRYRRRRPL